MAEFRTDEELLRLAAAAIRESLWIESETGYVDFAGVCGGYDPKLTDLRPPRGQAVAALWSYADTYFHQREHGDSDMDGTPWDEAKEILLEALGQVERGEEITSPAILRYGKPISFLPFTAIDWLRGKFKRRP